MLVRINVVKIGGGYKWTVTNVSGSILANGLITSSDRRMDAMLHRMAKDVAQEWVTAHGHRLQ